MIRQIARTRPSILEEDIPLILSLIEHSLRSGMLTMGPLVSEFEAQFAATIGVKHAIAVNSGAAALEIALRCISVSGREVIVPTETFVASANTVLLAGGTPVFAEIHPDTLCLDFDDVERRITPRTAAVMIVHMAGLIPPDIDRLIDLCNRHGLALVEDAAHAHGASLEGRCAGKLGRAGCFSFYPTKVMTTAEGGMITTDDDALSAEARSRRNHGVGPGAEVYVRVSSNFRMSEINAAVGLVQLKRLNQFVQKRNALAAQYDLALASLSAIKPLAARPTVHSYWNYLALLEEGIDRPRLAHVLREQFGVQVAWPYDPPCHLQPVFQEALRCKPGDLPRSERILARHIALPMHIALSDDDIIYVVDSLSRALEIVRTP